jgi:hypothetical protein
MQEDARRMQGHPKNCCLKVTGAIGFKQSIEDNKEVVMTRTRESLVYLVKQYVTYWQFLDHVSLSPGYRLQTWSRYKVLAPDCRAPNYHRSFSQSSGREILKNYDHFARFSS